MIDVFEEEIKNSLIIFDDLDLILEVLTLQS
jgi:hypothetical protein